MDRIGHYKLAQQSGGLGLFAEVRVTLSERSHAATVVADSAFAWLKEDYGPDAWEWAECDEFRSAAVRAADFALEHAVTPAPKVGVTIELIRAAPADTTAACVAYATCFAVWDALDDPGDGSVQLLGGDVFFAGRAWASHHQDARPTEMRFSERLDPATYADDEMVEFAVVRSAGVPAPIDLTQSSQVSERLWHRIMALGTAYALHFPTIIDPTVDTVLNPAQCESLSEELEFLRSLLRDPAAERILATIAALALQVRNRKDLTLVVSPL